MNKLILVIICTFLFISKGIAGTFTDLILSNQNDPKVSGYLEGLAHGIMESRNLILTESGYKLFCPPPNLGVDANSALTAIAMAKAANPQFANEPAYLALLGFRQLMPCF